MKKKLILVTEGFPFGKGEKPLIQPELDVLSENFDVTIISHAPKETVQDLESRSDLGNDVQVVNIDMSINILWKIILAVRFFLDLDGWKELFTIIRSKKNVSERLYQSIGFYILAMYNWKEMKRKGVIQKETAAIYYSYWYFYYTYSMTSHSRKYPNIKIVTRTHGFDLYDERYKGNRQPFKKLMDSKLNKIFFVCENAKKYYENKEYSFSKNKYEVCRMGVAITGEERIKTRGKSFCMVSCSNVIPLKRIPLIIDALKLWEGKKIEWHHFGDGEDLEAVRDYAKQSLDQKNNVAYCFHGFTVNEKVMQFYAQNTVSCFINVSETEGCPVAIQEAMAYGIPIVGTDVGGVSELINGNGILLSANPTAEEVCSAVSRIEQLSKEEYAEMQKASYLIWERDYQSVKNSQKLVQILNAL